MPSSILTDKPELILACTLYDLRNFLSSRSHSQHEATNAFHDRVLRSLGLY